MTLWPSASTDDEQSFQVRLFCECGSADGKLDFNLAGISSGRGDIGAFETMMQQPPYILTMSIPQNVSSHPSSRSKRSTDSTEACTA